MAELARKFKRVFATFGILDFEAWEEEHGENYNVDPPIRHDIFDEEQWLGTQVQVLNELFAEGSQYFSETEQDLRDRILQALDLYSPNGVRQVMSTAGGVSS